MKQRLDVMLVERGMVSSRERAKAYIKAGCVSVDGQCAMKAGSMYDESVSIVIEAKENPYVSRGGLKLDKAVREFSVDLNGKICVDIGASKGGFTDCMLQHGASKVYAIDVGTRQLDEKLWQDERVICMEQTNVRYIQPEDIPDQVEFAATDVSFISLTKILLPAKNLLCPDGKMVCLIKPQFEAGREKVGKKGVVKDKKVHREVIGHVVDYAVSIGFEILNLDYSPIKGPKGNIEYLLYMKKHSEKETYEQLQIDIQKVVERAYDDLD